MISVVNDNVEVRVKAISNGQDITNTAFYINTLADGSDTLLDFGNAFRTMWRANFLPLLHLSYEVASYEFRTIARLVNLATVVGAPPRPVFRYRDAVVIPGVPATDIGGGGDPGTPTFVGFGAGKVCGPTTWPDQVGIPAGWKALKGSTRCSPISEINTDAADQNRLLPAFIPQVQDAMDARKLITMFGTQWEEIVVSKMQDGQLWFRAGVLLYGIAKVTSYNVNEFVTSQVSRKQRGAA